MNIETISGQNISSVVAWGWTTLLGNSQVHRVLYVRAIGIIPDPNFDSLIKNVAVMLAGLILNSSVRNLWQKMTQYIVLAKCGYVEMAKYCGKLLPKGMKCAIYQSPKRRKINYNEQFRINMWIVIRKITEFPILSKYVIWNKQYWSKFFFFFLICSFTHTYNKDDCVFLVGL